MAFDKLIVNTIVRTTKDSIKFEGAIDKLKSKMLDLGKNLQNQIGVNKLPGLPNLSNLDNIPKLDINSLVSPETLKSIGEIPNKDEVLKNIEKTEQTLNNLLTTKNRISNVLYKTQNSLETTRKTADTISKILIGIQTGITIIKTLPIPTAYPPGVGVPMGIINTFSDVLDKLNDYVKKGKGPLSQIPKVLGEITKILQNIINKLNSLDNVILYLLQIIIILKTYLKYGPNATETEIQEVTNETFSNLDLSSIGNNSNININETAEEELLKCLQSNSNDPCIYKGFKLEVEYDPNNKFSFPSRRIKGYNPELNRLVYNNSVYESDNPQGYSFSSSLETLLSEIKYVIDTYLVESSITTSSLEDNPLETNIDMYPPFNEKGKNGEIREFKGEFYKFDSNLNQWVFIVIDLTPFEELGKFDGEIRENETSEENIEVLEERITDWNIFDGKKKYKITTIIYKVKYVSTYVWDISSFKWILKDKKLIENIEKSRKVKIIKK